MAAVEGKRPLWQREQWPNSFVITVVDLKDWCLQGPLDVGIGVKGSGPM